MSRITALIGKELVDQRRNPMLFMPVVIVALVAIMLPLMVAIIIPRLTDEKLSDSSDIEVAFEMYRDQPALLTLDPEGAIALAGAAPELDTNALGREARSAICLRNRAGERRANRAVGRFDRKRQVNPLAGERRQRAFE